MISLEKLKKLMHTSKMKHGTFCSLWLCPKICYKLCEIRNVIPFSVTFLNLKASPLLSWFFFVFFCYLSLKTIKWGTNCNSSRIVIVSKLNVKVVEFVQIATCCNTNNAPKGTLRTNSKTKLDTVLSRTVTCNLEIYGSWKRQRASGVTFIPLHEVQEA